MTWSPGRRNDADSLPRSQARMPPQKKGAPKGTPLDFIERNQQSCESKRLLGTDSRFTAASSLRLSRAASRFCLSGAATSDLRLAGAAAASLCLDGAASPSAVGLGCRHKLRSTFDFTATTILGTAGAIATNTATNPCFAATGPVGTAGFVAYACVATHLPLCIP